MINHLNERFCGEPKWFYGVFKSVEELFLVPIFLVKSYMSNLLFYFCNSL